MLWMALTTFFIIAKLCGGLTFSWWWISLMVFLDFTQFVVDTVISDSISKEDVEAEDEESKSEEEEAKE